jgi:lipid II:glycine glycyltransferase (peptidoglycan interpeptide bridge formation enzyme)
VSQSPATVDPQAWDAELAAMPNPHLLQSFRWGELQSRFGWEVHRRHVEVDGRQVPVSVLVTPTLVPGGTRGYVAKGPALTAERIKGSLEPLAALAQELELAFITIEPEIEAGWTPPEAWHPATATQPEHTAIVDLQPETEAILASFKPKTRYNVRVAERKGVAVEESDDIAAFAELAEMTSARHRIQLAGEPYYRAVHELLGGDGSCRIYLARHAGQALAGIMVLRFAGRATYLFGASAAHGRNLMPAYLLHWHAIQEMRKLGDKEYDLWGMPPEDQPGHPLSGLWQFKSGFGGRFVSYAGAFDFPVNVTVWRTHLAMAKMRGTLRRVRSKVASRS